MPAKKASPKIEEKKSGYQGYKCYVTFHPSSVLEGGFQLEGRISEDLRRFSRGALLEPVQRLPDTRASIGFDTEYDSSGKLLTVGVADATSGAAFECGEFKKATPVVKKAKVLVGHSVAGDLDHLVRLGLARDDWLRGINIRDSLLLARMYDENRGKGAYGLETLLLSEFNFSSWKDETAKLLKKTGNAADWRPEQRIARCRLDAWATVVLAEHFEEKLNDSARD